MRPHVAVRGEGHVKYRTLRAESTEHAEERVQVRKIASAGARNRLCAAVVIGGVTEGWKGRLPVSLSLESQYSGVVKAIVVGRCGVDVFGTTKHLILYSLYAMVVHHQVVLDTVHNSLN